MTKLGQVILRDTRANQPAAGVEGRLYYVTDETVLERDSGSVWQDVSTAGGAGTVTSVAMTVPAEFSLAGSPIISSGTFAVTKANQNANLVFAGPVSGGAAAPTFRALVAADYLDALINGSAGVILDHFLNIPPQSSQGNSGLGLTANASGSSAGVSAIAPPTASDLGVIDCSHGTNGRAGVFSYNGSPGLSIQLGGGILDLTWRFRVPTLPTGGNDYEATLGFIDSVNTSHTDGCYILLSSASANFRYITRQNSTTTNTDSGLAAAANTWYIGRIVVNAAATSVTFTIDGANSQAVATNIPTGAGREVGIGAVINLVAGASARSLYLDYARFAWSGVSA